VSEFSSKNWKIEGGVAMAMLAAICLIALPAVVSYLLRIGFASDLTTGDIHALSNLILYALIFGLAVCIAMFLYGCYRKGTRPRLVFGLVSGAIIVAYSFVVLVASGLTSVLSSVGFQLDAVFAALMLTYASVVLMFSVLGEHIGAKRTPQRPVESAEPQQGGAP
jgi:hypothetical protein